MGNLQGSSQVSTTALGITAAGNVNTTAAMGIDPIDDTLAAGAAGIMGVAAANVADIALPAEHGLSGGTYDVHWADDGNGKPGCRYGVAGTVAGDVLSAESGAGDNLPTAGDIAVVVQVAKEYPESFDGDLLKLLGCSAVKQAQFVFYDSGNAVLLAIFVAAGGAYSWASGQGASTPITGNPVDHVTISNGSAQVNNVKLTGLRNAS